MNLAAILRDILLPLSTTIAAGAGTYVALAGLSTWKRQLTGQSDHELARRLLVDVYKYRKAVQNVRSPAMFGFEIVEMPEEKRAHATPEQIKHYGIAQAYQTRWNKVNEQRAEIDGALFEAEAIWGDTNWRSIFAPMFSLERDLMLAIRKYLAAQDPDQNRGYRDALAQPRIDRDVIYDLSEDGKPDNFQQRLDEAVQKIEKVIKPKLAHQKPALFRKVSN